MILDQISKLDKILILGFAREGQSTYNFLRSKFPNLRIGLADQNPPTEIPKDPNIETYFGQNYLWTLNTEHWTLVIKTPGISPHKPEIQEAIKNGVIFTSQTEIFFETCPGKIIGVTGTKGKSTTASLIYHVLSQNNIKSILVGNIGKPALDFLDEIYQDTWVVVELSSYQLMDLQKSPQIAVLQNIYPDHLDYHQNFEEYTNAKLNITKYQTSTDLLITAFDTPTQAKKIIIDPEPVESNLLGRHNLFNIKPSIIIGELLGIPKSRILDSIKTFVPLDTRLTPIATVSDITFYEDVLATIPEATIAAIDALSGINSGVKTLIAGGHDRKQNYSILAENILNSGISTLILFPETGNRIEQAILNSPFYSPSLIKEGVRGRFKIFHVSTMSDAVNFAFENTPKNGLVLLSPAAPSFTLFKDYRDESSQYRAAIQNLSIN